MIDLKPLQKTHGNSIPVKAFAAYVNSCGSTDVQDAWKKARPVREFYAAHKGEKNVLNMLTFVDLKQEAYGDWKLYRDEDGNYYDDYFSIGD